MILRIFDVSQYIYAGIGKNSINMGVTKEQGVWVAREMPAAGISVLMNTIAEYRKDDTVLAYCFDRIPTYKRELHSRVFPAYGGYKGHRPRKTIDVTLQQEMAEEIIRQIGLNAFAVEGYEADDCIASLVHYYKDDFEKVYIHTRDSDAYYLVDNTVECVPVNNCGVHVTRDNWEQVVKPKGRPDEYLMYNTLTLQKILTGETSDNIPCVTREIANKIKSRIPERAYPYCGDNEALRKVIADITNNDLPTMAITDLIMPVILPEENICLHEEEFNEELYQFYAVVSGCKYFRRIQSVSHGLGEETCNRYIDEYLRR